MPTRTAHVVAGLIRCCEPTILRTVIDRCGGHGILDPQRLIAAGLDRRIVEHYTDTLRSDGSPKGSIFVDGKPVDELRGVYSLTLLEGIARARGVAYPASLGRGSQARAIKSALQVHLNADNARAAPGS